MRIHTLLFIITIMAGNIFVAADLIILRDGAESLRGTILSGGESGLRIELTNAQRDTRLIPWSSVLEIQSARPHPSLQIFLQQGIELNRAKQRLLRGDVVLAEPLFLEAFARLMGSDTEDARLASEGLLRCAISRGDYSIAVHPWLETVRLEELTISTPFSKLQPILDPSTMLCPHLPPVWIAHKELISICNDYRNLPQSITASIATSIVSNKERIEPIEGLEDSLFLPQILLSSVGDVSAMNSLLDAQDKMPEWKRAWAHFFIAKGYLHQHTEETKTSGLIYLAKVAAINPKVQPWLSCASMLILSDAMEEEGAEEASLRIRNEATRLFPEHPLHTNDQFQLRSSIQ